MFACLIFVIASLLPPGDARPPLFIVIGVDGAGDAAEVRQWTAAAARADAHFTFFLSGVYLLAGDQSRRYRPPLHRAGASDIGFALARDGRDVRDSIRDLVSALNAADAAGMEIASHFNGHFCGSLPGAVGTWGRREWLSEIDSFDELVRDVGPNNGLGVSLRLPAISGARTPCFEGRFVELHAAMRARGYTYDASVPGLPGGPEQEDGLWIFSTPLIDVPDEPYRTLASDYNFLVNELSGDQLRRGLDDEVTRRLGADRAPLSIAFHFEDWNDGAYRDALFAFARITCTRPDVRCVSYRELARVLDGVNSEAPPLHIW